MPPVKLTEKPLANSFENSDQALGVVGGALKRIPKALLVGLQGPQGEVGPQGPAGDPGSTGQTGPQGPAGLTGPQGPKGDTGDAGPQGQIGPQGNPGPQGDPGPTGDAGPQGQTGPQGEVGPQGVKGDTGDAGLQGLPGEVPSARTLTAGYGLAGGGSLAADRSFAVSLTNSFASLSGDVAMATAGTFYDGPSLSLAAGTWLLIGQVQFATVGNNQLLKAVAKLWNGTTAVSSGECHAPALSGALSHGRVSLSAVVVLAGTTTYKISGTATVNGHLMKASTPDGGSGNNATSLIAVRLL
jgi:hypothetical protein